MNTFGIAAIFLLEAGLYGAALLMPRIQRITCSTQQSTLLQFTEMGAGELHVDGGRITAINFPKEVPPQIKCISSTVRRFLHFPYVFITSNLRLTSRCTALTHL